MHPAKILTFITLGFIFSFATVSANAQSYVPIAGKKPTNPKAKNITFVGCAGTQLVKYVGPRKDVGAAKNKGVITAVAAKKLIKPKKKPAKASRALSGFETSAAVVNGKIPFATKKTLTALETEIDACAATKTATSTGSWLDELRNTNGSVSLSVSVNDVTRTGSFTLESSGFPLGVVDAANLPPESHSFTVPEGQTSAPIEFDSAYLPGNVDGNVTIDETAKTFSASGTILHSAAAGDFAGTTATFTASGPLAGANLGTVSISGVFAAGGNNFNIGTAPANSEYTPPAS